MKRTIVGWLAGPLLLIALGAPAVSAESLGELLRGAGWDRIVGVWVDQETNGQNIRLAYAWKFADKLIELSVKTADNEATALIGVNGKTGEVYQVGADSKGTGSLGKWSAEDGDAVLDLGFVTEDGNEGRLKIRHHLQDADTMVVTIDGDKPVAITLVRSAER